MTRAEQGHVPGQFLKPGAFVNIGDRFVEKRMGLAEVEAYAVLDRFRDQLHDNQTETFISIPHLVDYDEVTEMGTLTKVGDFKRFSCTEFFGRSNVYTPAYFAAAHAVASTLRTAIPANAVPNTNDYEATTSGNTPWIDFLTSGLAVEVPEEVREMLEVAKVVNNKTQDIIEPLPLHASHLDLNPNNFHITEHDDAQTVAVVDWETFGLSRVGFDEGRLMTYFALNPSKQQEYGEFARNTFSGEELVNFWRVAINRGVREYISLSTGHYDARLAAEGGGMDTIGPAKTEIMDGASLVVANGVAELEGLGIDIE